MAIEPCWHRIIGGQRREYEHFDAAYSGGYALSTKLSDQATQPGVPDPGSGLETWRGQVAFELTTGSRAVTVGR
jgi:hypothetical protein